MKRQEYIEGRSFINEDYTEKQPAKGEYENCTFTGCNFSNTDLSGYGFPECEFRDCDFSMAKLKDTVKNGRLGSAQRNRFIRAKSLTFPAQIPAYVHQPH